MQHLPRLALLLMSFVFVVHESEAYRVLFIGAMSGKSHRNFYMGVIKELAERGNHVTFITPYPSQRDTPNVREVIVPDGSMERFKINHFVDYGFTMIKSFLSICSETLATKQVQNLLKDDYDVIFMSVFFHECYLSFVHHLQVPFIYVSPNRLMSMNADVMGNPNLPALVTQPFLSHGHPLTFLQRTTNVVFEVINSVIFRHIFVTFLEWDCRSCGLCPEDMPSINEIQKNASLIILNSVRELEEPPRPYVQNIIHAGGIHCRPAKPLPQDLEKWIKGAGEEGFIFFSLGSHVTPSDLPEKNLQILVSVFSSLKQRVLFKWDKESMPDMPSNVRIGKWFPQQDILGHPKLRLFITHGGLLSTLEATYHGKPIIGMPVFADQTANMMEVDRQGWGETLLWDDLTEKELLGKINSIMADKKLHQEVKFRSSLMRDRPMAPGSLVSYWTDYVIRHKGARHLRCPIADMPWYKVYNMDVWIAIMVGSALLTWLSYRCLCGLIRCLCGKSKAKMD